MITGTILIVLGVLEQCSCKNIHLWETEGAIGEEALMQLSSIFKEMVTVRTV